MIEEDVTLAAIEEIDKIDHLTVGSIERRNRLREELPRYDRFVDADLQSGRITQDQAVTFRRFQRVLEALLTRLNQLIQEKLPLTTTTIQGKVATAIPVSASLSITRG